MLSLLFSKACPCEDGSEEARGRQRVCQWSADYSAAEAAPQRSEKRGEAVVSAAVQVQVLPGCQWGEGSLAPLSLGRSLGGTAGKSLQEAGLCLKCIFR